MLNFLLGLVAGSLIACIGTIAAARNPEVQMRLGLVAAQPALAAAPSEPPCPAKPKAVEATPSDIHADALFSRKRFWYVAP